MNRNSLCEMSERMHMVQMAVLRATLRPGTGVLVKVSQVPCSRNGTNARRSKGMPCVR